MANKNYLDASEVPKLTGDTEKDIKRLHAYLCNMAGQTGYEITAIKGQMTQQTTLTQEEAHGLST